MPIIKVKSSSNDVTSVSGSSSMVHTSESVTNIDSATKNNFCIPKHLFSGFADVLRNEQLKLARNVASEFGISYKDLISRCLPETREVELTEEPEKPKSTHRFSCFRAGGT